MSDRFQECNDEKNERLNGDKKTEKLNKDEKTKFPTYKEYYELSPEQLNAWMTRLKEKPGKSLKIPTYVQKPLKRFYQPGIVAKIDSKTTDNDLCKLLRHDVRTLLVHPSSETVQQQEQIMLKINTAMENFQMETIYNLPIGLAVEVKGQTVQTGRLRNFEAQEIQPGKLMVLTTDESYKYISVKEVIYVSHLWRYKDSIKIGDIIYMNEEKIRLRVVKKTNKNITVCIEAGDYIKSYMDVKFPFTLNDSFIPSNDDFEDIEFAVRNNAHFIVIPHIKSFCWLITYKKYVNRISENFEFAGRLPNLNEVASNFELQEIIKQLDVIWIPNLFQIEYKPKKRFTVSDQMRRLIKCVKQMKKPIVAGIPIATRKDFYRLEKHEILKSIDSMYIEKSPITKTFPIISKELQPIPKDVCNGIANPICKTVARIKPEEGLMNCMNYMINTTPCQGIIVSSTLTKQSITHLSAPEIYCPVIAVVSSDVIAKSLNIWRNIKTVVADFETNDKAKVQEYLRYGLDFGRDQKIFWTGDFILTIYNYVQKGTFVSSFSTFYLPIQNIVINQGRLNKTKSKV